jgi:hypothetical protein
LSKVTLSTILSGFYSTQTINNNFDELVDALDNTLSRDGSAPNSMEADLDLNGYGLLNASITLSSYTVATLPAASADNSGQVVYVSNGDSGSACLGVSNGATWLRVALGAAVSAP